MSHCTHWESGSLYSLSLSSLCRYGLSLLQRHRQIYRSVGNAAPLSLCLALGRVDRQAHAKQHNSKKQQRTSFVFLIAWLTITCVPSMFCKTHANPGQGVQTVRRSCLAKRWWLRPGNSWERESTHSIIQFAPTCGFLCCGAKTKSGVRKVKATTLRVSSTRNFRRADDGMKRLWVKEPLVSEP